MKVLCNEILWKLSYIVVNIVIKVINKSKWCNNNFNFKYNK